jgi:HAD superfamily phosphatase
VAARAAGMWALGVIPPYGEARIHERHLAKHGAHHVMRSLNELPRLLEALVQPREDDTAAAA